MVGTAVDCCAGRGGCATGLGDAAVLALALSSASSGDQGSSRSRTCCSPDGSIIVEGGVDA